MSGWYEAHLATIQTTLIYVPLALSIQICLRSGVFSVAGPGFFSVGGYGAGILALHKVPIVLSIVIAVIVSILIAFLLTPTLLRLRGLYLAMVTFAFDLILTVIATNGGSLTGGATGLIGIPGNVTTLELFIAVLLIVIVLCQVERQSLGRVSLAMKISDDLTRSVGVSLRNRQRWMFTLSAALGALSGTLYVLVFTTIQPSTGGFSLVIAALTMAVIGGVGSWSGALIGAILITWGQTFLFSVGQYHNLVYGVLLVIVVIFAPDGTQGLLKRALRILVSRWKAKALSVLPPKSSKVESESAWAGQVMRPHV